MFFLQGIKYDDVSSTLCWYIASTMERYASSGASIVSCSHNNNDNNNNKNQPIRYSPMNLMHFKQSPDTNVNVSKCDLTANDTGIKVRS